MNAETVRATTATNSRNRHEARGNLNAETVRATTAANSRNRHEARGNLNAETVMLLREINSNSREAARNDLLDDQLVEIRAINANHHVNSRIINNTRDYDSYREIWGDIEHISQRTVEPKNMEDYADFEQHTGSSKFLSHESLGVVQQQENSTFLQNESTFMARLTHMEILKVRNLKLAYSIMNTFRQKISRPNIPLIQNYLFETKIHFTKISISGYSFQKFSTKKWNKK